MALRNFDHAQQFEAIKKSVSDAVKEIFPVEGKLRSIRLVDSWVDDSLAANDYDSQTQAKNKEMTWGTPVYASLELIDKATGKVIDSATKVRLFTLPKLTDRASYIVKGSEYQVHNQLRLKSGVYTLRKKNGELKTQINLAKGKNFDLSFNERSGLFTIQKVGGGQANIPLYPVLTYLGVSPSGIASVWGSQLQQANHGADPKAVGRAEVAFGVKTGDLKGYFAETKIGADTTKTVLGESFEKVDGPMLLAASKHLLDVHQGKKEATDRDSLVFKELHSVEDFIHERIQKNKQPLAFKLRRNVDNLRRTKLTQIVNPGSFHSVVESFFTQDDKSSTPEQTNPLEMLSGAYKATVMGSGGITSEHTIKNETREVHPSHYGFLDPVHTPESDRVGVNLHLPMGVVKDGKDMRMIVRDKAGATSSLSPTEAFNKHIAFPGQTGDIVKVQYQGKVLEVPKAQVDYITPNAAALFSWSTNMIPYLNTDQGNRAMMASKMLEQAIALKHREAPLVQTAAGASTMENHVGATLAALAPADGVVKKVTAGQIVIKTADGDKTVNLYNNFTLNRKSFMNHEALVKAGDKVKAGQLLADSNFTKGGTLALGTNMRVAYIPYKGLSFEDGVVITDTAATKLTSEHIHKKSVEVGENHILGGTAFRSFYPNAITPDNMSKLDQDGVIKKGATVRQGEVMVALLQRRAPSAVISTVSRVLAERPKDASAYWTYEDEGKVLDVQRSGNHITVVVKTEERARIGDKIAGRHGNKGIITKIIPDHEAPRSSDGKAVEVMLNPHGIISRINVGQVYESAAAKTALKTGKPVSVKNFSGENYLETTKKLLADHGIDDKEELFDPATGKSLGRVHVGNPYILKLFKQGTVNFSVRQGGPGTPYDVNLQPLKAGGEEGAKAMDVLTTYSMLAHGARANLREMSSIKSNQNDEFWKALKSGQPLPPPKSPFVYDKFMGYLRAAGIDVKKDGSRLTLAPLTDKQVRAQSSGAIEKIQFYEGKDKDLSPKKGGFFDPVLTGGYRGDKWNHLDLHEPIVNPVFENAVSKLTGLGAKYEDLAGGKLHLDPKTDTFNTEGRGLTGGRAVEHLLKKIDVDKEITVLTKRAGKSTGALLDDANKKLRYLSALKAAKLTPVEAYIRNALPVIPAVYRPIYPLPDGSVTSASSNYLYQHVGLLNNMAKLPVMKLLAEEDKAPLRKDTYEAAKGIAGLTDLNIKGREREGFISEIKGGAGGQPKEGFFLSKMISKKQDFVGRGTIIPEPDLGVDQMGMPEEMAWKLFDPFVVRELKNHGKSPLAAKEEIKNRTPLAKRALDIVMSQRHVLLNRAPSLHKFSIMAFKPQITQGRALKIPPLVTKGFNADFDGDTMTVHVPISEEANREAEQLLPSRNLFKPGTNSLMVAPSQEAQIGMFYLSKTLAGRAELAKIVGPKFAPLPEVLDKKTTSILLQRMAKELPPPEFSSAVAKLKNAGDRHSYETGFTLGLEDLSSFAKDRDKIIQAAQTVAKSAKNEATLMKANVEATALIDKMIETRLKNTNNPLYDMVESGARGDKTQLRSIVATPLFMSDARGKIVPTPIKKSYSEGLDVGDYWISMYGARRGAIDRSIQTSLPGAFSKDVMATTIDNVITAADCGTKDGITLKIDDLADALDRYTAGDQAGVPHNTLVNQQVLNGLKSRGAQTIKVRSPLTCHRAKGTCAHCHGLDEHGKLPDLGDNIGAKAGQTISEPLIQIVMNSRHTGGVAGTGADVGGYQRIDQLLKLPKILTGSATLAPKAAKITKIEKGVGGGYNVYVGDIQTYVGQGRALQVKVGDIVAAGDRLSDGAIRPQDLVRYKGMQPAQEYIVNELQKTYRAQGVPIQKRVFETVVRSLGNTTQILNNPRDTGHLPGDVAPYTLVQAYNRDLDLPMALSEAEGYTLSEAAGGLSSGHELTATDIKTLKAKGLSDVKVKKDAIVHAPFLKGMTTVPLLKRDWMAALGYRYLSKSLTEGASQGWKSDTAGEHPIPAIANAITFGQGKEGKY